MSHCCKSNNPSLIRVRQDQYISITKPHSWSQVAVRPSLLLACVFAPKHRVLGIFSVPRFHVLLGLWCGSWHSLAYMWQALVRMKSHHVLTITLTIIYFSATATKNISYRAIISTKVSWCIANTKNTEFAHLTKNETDKDINPQLQLFRNMHRTTHHKTQNAPNRLFFSFRVPQNGRDVPGLLHNAFALSRRG